MIIFDIGASSGINILKWYNTINTFYCFEPCKENYYKLMENLGNYKNVKIHSEAISNSKEIKLFNQANYTNSSSLLPFTENTKLWKNPGNNPELKTIAQYPVHCIRLIDFVKEHNIKLIDFLKIDTQGHDFEVIKSLDDFIYNVKELVCEVQIVDYELYKNSSSKKDLVDYMEKKNFSIYKIQKWSHDQEENIWFINNKYSNYLHLE